MRTRLLLIVAAAAVVSACATSTLPSPTILNVESPETIAYIGEDRLVVIEGEGFSEGITADAASPGDSKTEPASVFIQLEGGAADPIFVTGTFLGLTRFEGTIAADQVPELVPGRYDVGVINASGSRDVSLAAFEMGFRAVTLALVTTTATELAPGDSNRVTVEMRLLGANGQPGFRKEPVFSITPQIVEGGVKATMSPGFVEVAQGEYLDAVLAVHDSSVEAVMLGATGMPSDITVEELEIAFISGPPAKAWLLPAAEINAADNFADTFFVLEDQWENVCTVHDEYNASFSFGVCLTASANPDPVVVPSNAGSVPVRILCPVANDAFVTFTENTATGYQNGGLTIIDFN